MGRACPKFKHVCTILTLTTRTNFVICIQNIRFKLFYSKKNEELSIQQLESNFLLSGVTIRHKIGRRNAIRKAGIGYMSQHEHIIQARRQEEASKNAHQQKY